MWGNKGKVFRSWRLREIWDLSWKSSFQTKLGRVVCVILTSVFRSLLRGLAFFLEHSSSPSSVSHRCPVLLAPTLCSAIQPNPFRKGSFFKVGDAGYLQNDLFSASISKLKIVCFIAMRPVATGLHFLPTHALSHDRWVRDGSRSVREILGRLYSRSWFSWEMGLFPSLLSS